MKSTRRILVILCFLLLIEEIIGSEDVRKIRKRKLRKNHQKEHLEVPLVDDEVRLAPNPDKNQPIRRKVKIKRKKSSKNGTLRNPTAEKLDQSFAIQPSKLPEKSSNRSIDEARFLSLFTVARIKNEPCTSGGGNNGTCYSKEDCGKLGGVGSGPCSSGFGVCCLFRSTCGGSTSTNGTYFQNRGYPFTFDGIGSCQLRINKANSNVCQLRLDFDTMILAQPDMNHHQCKDDKFIVSGGSPIPAICGTNNGLHLYVDMGLTSNSPIVLTALTGGPSFSRKFSIKIIQIDCHSLSKASDGCLQYFTGNSGRILSFNYNEGTGLQLSETDYSVCIRTERNFCGIQYTACPDPENTPAMSFSISGSGNAGSLVGQDECRFDWFTIPCATNTKDPLMQNGTPQICVDRICGMAFNSVNSDKSAPVTSFSKPFVINVHTDDSEEMTELYNRGFCLNFKQLEDCGMKEQKRSPYINFVNNFDLN